MICSLIHCCPVAIDAESTGPRPSVDSGIGEVAEIAVVFDDTLFTVSPEALVCGASWFAGGVGEAKPAPQENKAEDDPRHTGQNQPPPSQALDETKAHQCEDEVAERNDRSKPNGQVVIHSSGHSENGRGVVTK